MSKSGENYQSYFDRIDLNGLAFYYLSDQTKRGRVFWASVIVVVLSLAVYWIMFAYWEWYTSPVLTVVSTTGFSVKDLEFPAVTFCSQGFNKVVLLAGFFNQFFKFLITEGQNPGITAYEAAIVMHEWHMSHKNTTALSQDVKTKLESLLQLLNDKGYASFINTHFTGLSSSDDIIGLLRLLSANDPRAIISAMVSNSGGFNPCGSNSLGIKPSTSISHIPNGTCSPGFVPDLKNSLCYMPLRNITSFYNAQELCTIYDAEVTQFESDFQVMGLLELLQKGNLSLSSESDNFFFLWAARDPTFIFHDGVDPINGTFKFLELQPDDGEDHCLTAHLDVTLNHFKLYQADCSKNNGTVCRKPLIFQPNCSGDPPTLPRHETLEFNLDPKLQILQNKGIAAQIEMYRDMFRRLNKTAAFSSIFSSLWYETFPCFDVEGVTSNNTDARGILKYCEWKGIEVPCAAIFMTFPTDQGMCCSFNIPAADEIFTGDIYSKIVNSLQEYDRNNSVHSTHVPNSYSANKEPKTQAGQNKGLVVLLDAHSDLVAPSTVFTDNQGFFGLVSPRKSFPLLNFEGFNIMPGRINSIGLEPIIIDAAEEVRSISPERRGCLFENEAHMLKIHKVYTQSNCIFECTLLYAQHKMYTLYNTSCIPWYYPDNKKTMCDPWDSRRFNNFMYGDIPDSQCSYCLPDCTTVIFDKTITSTPFRKCDDGNLGVSPLCNLNDGSLRNPQIFAQDVMDQFMANPKHKSVPDYVQKIMVSNIRQRSFAMKNGGIFSHIERDYDAFQVDIARVEVFFKRPTAIKIGSMASMTWIDFVSQIGGLLSLCVGASLVTFIELIWLCFRYWLDKRGCSKKAEKIVVM